MITLLSLIQQVCGRLAQPVPALVYGSTDKSIIQMMRLLEEGLDDLAGRGQWQELNFEYTWLTVALEDQGVLAAGLGAPLVAPIGFNYMLPETLWDRTNKLPLVGPLDAQDWQAMKAWVINGPRYQFRVRQRHFYVNPAPAAGYTWAFEYITENTILAADNVTYKKRFTLDTDQIVLPDSIVIMDLRWRWKKEKNLPYAEDFDTCEAMVMNALARARPSKTLYLDTPDCYRAPSPQLVVSPGNWPL